MIEVPSTGSGMFDINSDEAFFRSLQRAAAKLRSNKVKETAELLYLLMGVNHLRDWIAPGFNWKEGTPRTAEQHFGVAIFALPEFKVVNSVCNRSKHMGTLRYNLGTEYGTMIDEYPDIDSVMNMDDGPPIGYSVDGRNLLEIVDVVLSFYEINWFSRSRK